MKTELPKLGKKTAKYLEESKIVEQAGKTAKETAILAAKGTKVGVQVGGAITVSSVKSIAEGVKESAKDLANQPSRMVE